VLGYDITVVIVCDAHKMPKPAQFPAYADDAVHRAKLNLARCSGHSPPQFGLLDYTEMTIYVNGDLSFSRMKDTLLHEMGHLLFWIALPLEADDGGESGANLAMGWFKCCLNAIIALESAYPGTPILIKSTLEGDNSSDITS
jgi:hypothetical protein